jgi:hypothetical protein
MVLALLQTVLNIFSGVKKGKLGIIRAFLVFR